MLKVFQVNTGTFLDLHEELSPSQRVQDLTSEICRCTKSQLQYVVLMTIDGLLMDRNQIIASYGAGTDTKPILVFNQSLLKEPNLSQISLPEIRDICQNQSIEEMSKKPHSLLQLVQGFQSQADQMDTVFDGLLLEQDLQVRAWTAVQGNCQSILMTYQRQANSLTTEYTAFRENTDKWRREIERFPDTLNLLKKVRVPKTLTNKLEDVTLHEWISEQDPNSHLKDLAEDCTQALNKLSSDIDIDALLDLSKDIIGNVEGTPEGVPGWKERSEQLQLYKQEVKKIIERQREYSKTVKTTLQNALKSGDRTLVDDLKESQKQTLSVMAANDKKTRDLLIRCFKSKKGLTENIHGRLLWVTEIQQKMSESSKSIVLAREQLKLLRKKMSVFVQICDAPRVLTEVLGEILRRKQFDKAFIELTTSYNKTATEWKGEEKERRRSFLSSCGDHFLIRLFPGATEKPSLSKRGTDKTDGGAGKGQLTLEEARDIVNDLPEMLAQSFWTRSRMSLHADSSICKLPLFANNSSTEGSSLNTTQSLSPQPTEQERSPSSSLTAKLTEQESIILELRHEKDLLAKEKSLLLEDVALRETTNASLLKQVDELMKAKTILEDKLSLGELATLQLKEERDTLQRQLSNIRSSESELQMLHSKAEEELQLHRSQYVYEAGRTEGLQSKISQLEAMVTTLQESKEQLLEQSEFLKERNLSLLSEKDHLIAECRAHEDESRTLAQEKEVLVSQLAELEAATSAKSEHYVTMEMELEGLRKKQLQLEKLLEDASREQEDMLEEITKLKSKSTSSEVECNRSRREVMEEKEKSETLRKSLDEQMQSFTAMYSGLLAVRDAVGLMKQALSMPNRSSASAPSADTANSAVFLSVLDAVKMDIQGAHQHVCDLQSELVEAEKSNISLREGQEHLEDEKQQLLVERDTLRDENNVMVKQMQELEKEVYSLKGQVGNFRAEKEQLSRQLLEEETARKESARKMADLNSQLQAADIEGQSAFQSKITEMEEQHWILIEQLKQRDEDMRTSMENSKELQADKESLQSQLWALEEKHRESLQQECSRAESLELRVKELQKNLSQCKQDLDDAAKKAMELEHGAKVLEEEKKNMELELDAKEHMVKELQEKLLQCNKELDDAMKKNMELEQDAKVLEKEKKNMELELDAKELIMKELQEKFLQCKKELDDTVKKYMELEQDAKVLEKEKDEAFKKKMELERDAKELQRSVDRTLSEDQRDGIVKKRVVPLAISVSGEFSEMNLSTSEIRNPALTDSQSFVTISVKSVCVGDVVLFMALRRDSSSHKEVYIAVTFDSRVYFLDTERAKKFEGNLTQSSIALGNSGKRSFLGRVTHKQLCEIRKSDNRLGVPVGTKVYRLHAEECFLVPYTKPL